MKYLQFGMAVESQPALDSTNPDFKTYRSVTGTTAENVNPYGQAWFDDPTNMARTTTSPARITSIPSPYARMHITDLAFREFITGSGTMDAANLVEKGLSLDYLRAMSHCLDFFELFYYFDDLDLGEKGIAVERIPLVSTHNASDSDLLDHPDNKQLKSYIKTLDLYRDSYLRNLEPKRPANFFFNFDTMYVVRDVDNQKIIGATSPFTGFFAKSDCNVVVKGKEEARLHVSRNGYNHKLLTDSYTDWKLITERPLDFLKFLYLLLKDTGLKTVFVNLFKAVEKSIELKDAAMLPQYNGLNFEDEYPEYNFGNDNLPKILSQKEAYLRSDCFDRSYLKYLLFLYLKKPVDLKVSKKSYENGEISERRFPDDSDRLCPWICVNDFLSDALFVLPYEINDKYVAVDYLEKATGRIQNSRCLLPIKQRILEYFPELSLVDIANNLSITRYEDGHYAVTYRVKLDRTDRNNQPVTISLRREYRKGSYEYPDGLIIDDKEIENFAFGIYPFVKTSKYTNIYKVLFYNKFNRNIDPRNAECHLDFFYFDINPINRTKRPIQFNGNSVKMNYTGTFDPEHPASSLNTIYYSIEEPNETNRVKTISFAELHYAVKNQLDVVVTDATALIVPKMMDSDITNDKIDIAVDLGTSNTYVAYRKQGDPNIKEINTIHSIEGQKISEVQFMNVEVTTAEYDQVIPKYGHDLYLPTEFEEYIQNEDPNKAAKRKKAAWTGCMPAQFCEFIPSHIVPSKDAQKDGTFDEERKGEGFSFPIPSVINCLKLNAGTQLSPVCADTDELLSRVLPLTHSAIPFAYYDIGKRKKGDTIAEGDFKWFYKDHQPIEDKKRNLTLFVSELMFILRSHMLSEGYPLDQCRLVWTYPLSFDRALVEQTTSVWQAAYKKYFNPAADEEEIDQLVMRTNESLSPFYYCANVGAHDFSVLMDIGGGSTDVIGYNQGTARFITSFEFAGNALYLNSHKNSAFNPNTPNIIIDYLNEKGKLSTLRKRTPYFDDRTEPITTTIQTANGLSSLMNYGFQMFKEDFNALFQNKELHFMLKFFLSSLVYQTAQLSYWDAKKFYEEKGEEVRVPSAIYLTGNGSRLFDLMVKEDRDALIKSIFVKVFNKKDDEIDYYEELKVRTQKNPKIATARGAIKGLDMDVAFNTTPRECVVMLGDKDTVFNIRAGQQGIQIARDADRKAMLSGVRDNVISFIDLFYEILNDYYPLIEKNTMIGWIRNVENDREFFTIGTELNDSMFYNYIAKLMEKLSERLSERRNG